MQYAVRNAKIERYAVCKGGGGVTLIKDRLYTAVLILRCEATATQSQNNLIIPGLS